MNLYKVQYIENEIEQIAKDNAGEIPEEKLQELVEANTKSLVQVEKLCKYIRHLEIFVETCKSEKERINKVQKKAEKRLESVKKYMTPFVKEKGKFDAGTFKLSTIKSERLILDPACNFLPYEEHDYIQKTMLDKEAIKKDLKAGKVIPGAKLEPRDNLQIK